jgi:uncharacterized protein
VTASPAIEQETIIVAGAAVVPDPLGVIYWPHERLLAVADLHLEKGSSFAARGMLLPPYDTAATLARLAVAVARYDPRMVIALGDSFHDGKGPGRIGEADRTCLSVLQRGREWIWITGNHDPDPIDGLGGCCASLVVIGPLTFRHHPTEAAAEGEVAGHLHPVARLSVRGRGISRRCFVTDGKRAVLPAFGAFTGGLNVRHHAFAEIFPGRAFMAHLLGERRLYTVAGTRCLPD